MKKRIILIILLSTINTFSQQGKIFVETNFNTFSHSKLSDFQKEFKEDIEPIPIKTTDNFPANIGFTLGYEIVKSNTSIFLSYNSTGGKLSYSDYSGNIKLEESLNAITFGGIYFANLSEKKDFRLGLKAFSMFSSLAIESYSKIENSIDEDFIEFNSFDIGFGALINYEYPLSFLILKANIGFDVVFGGKLKFKDNNKAHLINNSDEDVTTGWSGLRTGLGIAIPIN